MKNDLISRSALLDELKQQRDLETEIFTSAVNDGITTGIRVAIQLTKAAPAVDAVEVVRCAKCKHYNIARQGQKIYAAWREAGALDG